MAKNRLRENGDKALKALKNCIYGYGDVCQRCSYFQDGKRAPECMMEIFQDIRFLKIVFAEELNFSLLKKDGDK